MLHRFLNTVVLEQFLNTDIEELGHFETKAALNSRYLERKTILKRTTLNLGHFEPWTLL